MSEQLISQLRESTVAIESLKADHAQSLEKANGRIDELEAMITRASAMSADTATKGSEPDFTKGETPIYRKSDSLVRGLHGHEGAREAQELSLGRLLKGAIIGNWKGADREHELMRTKGQTVGSGPAGGFLLPSLVDAAILDIARPQSVVQRLGGGFINVQGYTALPRLSGDVTPHWRANDTAAINESTMAFATQNITPRTVGFLVRCSRELLEDSGPELDRFIREVFAAAYASELDRVVLSGAGVTEPIGLLSLAGTNSLPISGAADYDDLIDGAREVYEANFAGTYGELGIVLNPRTWAALAKTKGTANDHYMAPPSVVSEMQRAQTMHVPIVSSATSAIVGDFRQVAIAQRTGLTIEVSQSEGDSFSKLQVAIRGYARLDVAVFRPAWFSVLSGITN